MGALEPIQDNLVPVFEAEIDGIIQPVVNARELHAFLKVQRDFSTWIKGRIQEYRFVKNVDYIIVQNLTSPKRGTSKSRQRVLIDYYLSLDMAKELGMVEKTDKGREVRRYFIKCEKVLMQVNNNLMMQFNRALLEFEKFSDLASQAGRTLNYVGKQLKPQSKSKLDALGQKIQPMLNLFEPENEKADSIRQDKSASSNPKQQSKGTDV